MRPRSGGGAPKKVLCEFILSVSGVSFPGLIFLPARIFESSHIIKYVISGAALTFQSCPFYKVALVLIFFMR